MANLLRVLCFCFEAAALVVYHIPRWLVSGMQILLYEDGKGNWTLVRHFRAQMMGHMLAIGGKIGVAGPSNPDHTAPGGIWIPAVLGDLIVGEIRTFAHDRNIESISIPGYWIHKDERLPFESHPSPGEKIICYLHGGGYFSQTAHPEGLASRIVKDFLQNSSTPSIRRTFAVEYRLTSAGRQGEESVFPFPTALLDALAGYLYLLKLGFLEENIILVGDSAGRNLILALIRYLLSNKEQQPELPKVPDSIVLLSPWTDLTQQFNQNPAPQSSLTLNVKRDWFAPMNSGIASLSARLFLGGCPEHIELAYRNPYISPASPILLGLTPDSPTRTISFKGFPRTFIDNGRFESLYDQIRDLGRAMVEDLGEEVVTYNEVDGAVHDHMAMDWHDPDRTVSCTVSTKNK